MSLTRGSRGLYGWLLVSPFALTLLVLFVYALVRAVYFSLTNYNLFDAPQWVGLTNFLAITRNPLFIDALVNTVLFSVIVTTLQTVLALFLAVIVGGNFVGKNVFRVAFYVPAVLSSASVTLVFIWFYQKNGFLNAILSSVANVAPFLISAAVASLLGLSLWFIAARLRGQKGVFFDPVATWFAVAFGAFATMFLARSGLVSGREVEVAIDWIGSRENVGPLPRTMWSIVIQNTYTTVPTFMLLFIAGLQGIPKSLYEAARVDGASRWHQFIHVTVPQLAPVIFVVVTFGVIGTLQIFDQVALLGDATPLESRITLAYFVYHSAFPPGAEPNIGLASAAAFVLAGITLAIVYLQKVVGIRERSDV